MPSPPAKMKNENFVNTSKNLSKKQKLSLFCSVLFHMKTRVSPKYLVNDCRLSSPKDESWSLISKVTGLGPATLLNKRLQNRRFPVNFAKFLRWSFLQNTSRLVLFSFYAQILVMIISSSGFFLYLRFIHYTKKELSH